MAEAEPGLHVCSALDRGGGPVDEIMSRGGMIDHEKNSCVIAGFDSAFELCRL